MVRFHPPAPKFMHIVKLHDKLNPDRIVPIDAADFSAAFPYLGGSWLRLKDGDQLFPISETPEQIMALIEEASSC